MNYVSMEPLDERLRLFGHDVDLGTSYTFLDYTPCNITGGRVEGINAQLAHFDAWLQQSWPLWQKEKGQDAIDKICTQKHMLLTWLQPSDNKEGLLPRFQKHGNRTNYI